MSELIKGYYKTKLNEYNSKYSCGSFTHIHTGYFNPQLFPLLYTDIELENYGIEKIKNYMHIGQELLVSDIALHISTIFSDTSSFNILDCGAGHGGTTIFLANCFQNATINALTLSEDQASEIYKNLRQMNMNKNNITITVNDIFDCNYCSEFDVIVAIDSLCQMGDTEVLYKKLHSFLKRNGLLIISDTFLLDHLSKFKKYFNDYWKSKIVLMSDLLSVVSRLFVISEIRNDSDLQLPFWKLSTAYSNLLLNNHLAESPQRISQSLAFHNAMIDATVGQEIGYYKIILKRL